MKVAGIYKITHKTTGRVYIGKSKNIQSRLRYHKKESSWESKKDKNKHLYLAFRKYGVEAFSFETIWVCPGHIRNMDQILNRVECYFIDKYEALTKGFNKTSGGDGVRDYEWSASRREKHLHRMRTNHPMSGKKQSEFAIQRIKETQTGRCHSEEEKLNRRKALTSSPTGYNKKKICCYFADTMELYKIFESMEKATIETKTAKPNISKCCKGERDRAGSIDSRKLTWRYFSEQPSELL